MTFTTVAILFNCEFMPRSCLVIAETLYVDLHLFTDSSSISTCGLYLANVTGPELRLL